MNDRILEIDNQLSDIQLSTCRQNKALQIERDALTGHSVSAETTAYINNIIASQPEQSIKEKKPRGRPKKIKTPVTTEASYEAAIVEHQIPLIERHYNLRRRNNN